MTASAPFALFLTRISFGVFIAIWGLNKIMAPAGTERIFAAYYGIDGLEVMVAQGLGAAQIVVGLAIMAGALRTLSYGIGVLIHGASTLATLPHLILPFAEGSNLLFWTGVPVLCAATGLFLARREDVMLSLDARLRSARGASYGT